MFIKKSVLILILFLIGFALCCTDLMSWHNFNNSSPELPIENLNRENNINLLIFKDPMNIQRKDHMSIRLHLNLNNHIRSRENLNVIKANILKTEEITIQIIADLKNVKEEEFCIFCLLENKDFEVSEYLSKCSYFDFGMIKNGNKIEIISKDIYSRTCNSMKRTIRWKSKYNKNNYQNIIFTQNKYSKKVFINGEKIFEMVNPHSHFDISNWNDNSYLFIGGDSKKTKKASYVDIYDIAIWNKVLENKKFEHVHRNPLLKSKKMTKNWVTKNWISNLKNDTYDDSHKKPIYKHKNNCTSNLKRCKKLDSLKNKNCIYESCGPCNGDGTH